MITAGPTIVTVATDSAWVVIMAVSLVTLPAAFLMRRLLRGTGGFASGLLVSLPLALPLLAALLYAHDVLPEFQVLKPVREALRESTVLHLLPVADHGVLTPYVITGSAGPWLLLIGLSVSSFMLLRRSIGVVVIHKLIRRCRPYSEASRLPHLIRRLSGEAGLQCHPQVLQLPNSVSGAFVVGGRTKYVLISRNLVECLDHDELEAILAHEIAHLAARDVSLVFTAGILRDMVAWNPLAHIAYRRLLMDRELEADRRAAALTARPLAVASGLIKVCEVMRANRTRSARVALAAIRPGGRLTRRVNNLLLLADGKTVLEPHRAPYLMAACVVAILGLQAGARVAGEHASEGLAIMWGASDGAQRKPWVPHNGARDNGQRARNEAAATQQASRKEQGWRDLARITALTTRPVRAKDWPRWVRAMNRLAQSRALTRWESRHNWTVEPLLQSAPGSSFGIYRIKQTP